MGIESVHEANDNVPAKERKPLAHGTYFCIQCNRKQEVNYSGILHHCPKCGFALFYQQ